MKGVCSRHHQLVQNMLIRNNFKTKTRTRLRSSGSFISEIKLEHILRTFMSHDRQCLDKITLCKVNQNSKLQTKSQHFDALWTRMTGCESINGIGTRENVKKGCEATWPIIPNFTKLLRNLQRSPTSPK